MCAQESLHVDSCMYPPRPLVVLPLSMTVSGGLTETSIQVASLQVTTGSGLPFLEPVDATSLITVDGARTKARVSLSHVAGNLSLNTLGLLLRLQQQALSLFALPDENAIAQCDLFNRILVYTGEPGAAHLGDKDALLHGPLSEIDCSLLSGSDPTLLA